MITIVKRVLVPVANGSEDIETMAIVDTLRRAKFHVDIVSVHPSESSSSGGGSLLLNNNNKTVTLARGCVLTTDTTIDTLPTELYNSYDCIALPGGLPGAEHLRDCALLISLLRQQKASSKYYAAVCASPAVVFATHGLLQNIHNVTCHPSFMEKLPLLHQQAFVSSTTPDTPISSPTVQKDQRVVVDNYCITSQGPGTSIEFALQIIASLENKELAETVAKPMLIGVPLQLV